MLTMTPPEFHRAAAERQHRDEHGNFTTSGGWEHGTYRGYRHGCTTSGACPSALAGGESCEAARRRYHREYSARRRAAAWRRSRQDVDVVTVDLAIAGERVRLTTTERHEAVRRLHRLLWSDYRIADALGVTRRTVLRDRHRLGLRAHQHNVVVFRSAA